MVQEKELKLLQERIAGGSISASTARRMGPAGTIKAAREFLSTPSLLIEFSKTTTPEAFQTQLDKFTEELRLNLPISEDRLNGQRWGSARKFINIFLLECTLNRYLCSRYTLEKIEAYLEVPLDGLVGGALRRYSGNRLLQWPGVIHLKSDVSEAYQAFAAELAAKHKVYRAHLDLYFYSNKPNELEP